MKDLFDLKQDFTSCMYRKTELNISYTFIALSVAVGVYVGVLMADFTKFHLFKAMAISALNDLPATSSKIGYTPDFSTGPIEMWWMRPLMQREHCKLQKATYSEYPTKVNKYKVEAACYW